MELQIVKNEVTPDYYASISGSLDAKTIDKLDELNAYSDIKKCIFDFKDLKHIELVGVMQWIHFTSIFFVGKEIFYKNCPMDWVMTMQQIPILQENVVITSVVAEFNCPECANFSENVIEINQDDKSIKTQEGLSSKCEDCMSPNMELLETEEEFFFFKNKTA